MPGFRRILVCSILFVAGSALARERQQFDALGLSPRIDAAARESLAASPLLKPGADLHTEERFGVPTFLWAAPRSPLPLRADTPSRRSRKDSY